MNQIALPLEPDRRSPTSHFIVGASNAQAVHQLAEWKRWPFGTAILVGPPRSGKSLLGQHFERRYGGIFIDDADRVDHTALFHHWNEARASMRPMIMASAQMPVDWVVTLPDLASRLASALLLEIRAPDDDMLAEMLRLYADGRGFALSEPVIAYSAPRIERDYAAAEAFVEALDRLALQRKTAPGIAMARELLAGCAPAASEDV